jgi:hypothetical protein
MMGCKGDPSVPPNLCPTYHSNIACLIQIKNGFKFNVRLSTFQTTLLKKAVFEVEFNDTNLVPYLEKDYLVKKLGIKDKSALCSIN